MIKNYIFDFGNVLAEFYPHKLTAPFVSDEETLEAVSRVVFDRVYWDKLDLGDISDDEVKEGICERLPDSWRDVACMVYDNWVNTMTPVKGMQQLVCDIKKSGKGLYLLSNISVKFAESYTNVKWIKELLSCFDGLVLSGEIGMVKPNKEIFEYLLNKFNLKADECLFIDDNASNVNAAMTMGIGAYQFDGDADNLRKYICL